MTNRILSALVLLGVIAACASSVAAQETRSYVDPRSVDDEGLPFSGAVWVGDMLYLSGRIGLEDGNVPATAEAEARLVLDQIKSVLEGEGLTMDDLVTVQVFSSDVSDYDAFNGVYRTYFTKVFPARAFVGVGTLLFGARFEVQGVASRR